MLFSMGVKKRRQLRRSGVSTSPTDVSGKRASLPSLYRLYRLWKRARTGIRVASK